MTVLRNNFNGGPDFANIDTSNSGQFGDNAFDVAIQSTKAVLQFLSVDTYNLNRPTAEYVAGMGTLGNANVNDRAYAAWTTSMGTQTDVWTRIYYRTISTTGTTADVNLLGFAGPGEGMGLFIPYSGASRVFQLREESTLSTNTVSSTTVVTAGQWYRLEMHMHFSGVRGTSSTELYIYADDDVDTDNYTELVTQTSADYGASAATQYILGQAWGTGQSIPDQYFSGWELNNLGYPGPSPFRLGLGSPSGNMTNPVAIHMN